MNERLDWFSGQWLPDCTNLPHMIEAASNHRWDMLREGQLTVKDNSQAGDLSGNWKWCKLCLLVHKASIGQAPTYIADMLTPVSSVQSLNTQRSATNGDYIVPRTHRKLAERAFSVAAPKAWNRLPTKLKTSTCSTDSFKRSLKTFLFQSVYGCETRVSWLL